MSPLPVRTWNVFHGRTFPESRQVHLERMIRLVVADGPAVVALQEVPVWAVRRLVEWSGMNVFWAVTKRALLGPLARPLQALEPRLVRSPFTGQANGLLLRKDLRALAPPETLSLTPRRAGEPRVLQFLELDVDGRAVVVANLHASANREQVARAVDALVEAERCLLCGDFNLERYAIAGFSDPIAGIDQILVRGLDLERPPTRWDDERRRANGNLLSDHAPVEAVVA